MKTFKYIAIIIVLLFAVYGAFGQRTFRIYIIPEIQTDNESLKEFEKAMREAVDDMSKRLESGGL